jgi:type II secretory pathway pseudopilin PulG
MRRHMKREEGSALVVAMIAIAMMLMIGLATYSMVDTQQTQASKQNIGEASFALANAALNAQMFQLGTTWPKDSATAYPSWCTSTGGAGVPCPDSAALSQSFTGAEYATTPACSGGVTDGWRTAVRDNGGGATKYYDPAVVPSQPAYDANADGSVWVRSEGTARCRTRAVVALVQLSRVPLPFPRNVITTNWLQVNPNGRKVIVDTLGNYAQPPSVRPPSNAQAGSVSARCVSAPTPCVKYDPTKGQISPDTTQTSSGGNAATLTTDQIAGLRLQAQTATPPTYYPAGTCPPSLTGKLVFVEDLTGCSGYRGGNSGNNPGVLVFLKGTLSLGGNGVFYGIVYAGNQQGSTGAVVTISGTAAVQGAIVVDGAGGVIAGSSATNVVYDPRAFALLQTLANATMVPNTWRQLPAGS